jgi:hypothetical protein
VFASLQNAMSKAKAPPPPAYNDSDDDGDYSDMDTSVSTHLPVTIDPLEAILNVLGPEQRALIKGLQSKNAELEAKASNMENELQGAKRKLEEDLAERERLDKRIRLLETEARAAKTQPTPGPPQQPASSAPPPYEAQLKDDFEEESKELEVYAKYQPLVRGGMPHPTALCSSTNLTDLLTREIKDSLQSNLHPDTESNKALSDAQLEAIALARRRNVVDKLAFAVGDATGVGKTRTALGYVFNNYKFVPTVKKPRVLYVSVSNLFDDVVKDAKAIGFKDAFTNGVKIQNKAKGEIATDTNLLFISHTVLASFTAARLLKWLLSKKAKAVAGQEPILIVDEVHKVANKTKRGELAATLLSGAHEAGAHILLLSATFASNVPQLQLTAKVTGIIRSDVHPEHPVADFKAISSTLRRLGEVGLEALTMQLRTSGGYVSRSLSMAGVEFELVEASMSAVDGERYTRAAALWKDLLDIPDLWSSTKMLGVYHSAALRFFKGLTMLIRLPAVITTAIEALERGESVILTCLSTDEASIARSAAEADDDGADDAEDAAIDNAETESRLKNGTLLDNINQVIAFARLHTANPSAIDALDRIAARAKALGLPVVGALDVAKHRLAAALGNDRSKIVELTGRQKMLKCEFGDDLKDRDHWTIVSRDESLLAGKQRFQEGTARVALLSAAASTGCSLHDLKGARRNLIAMELPYSSIQYVQTVGRAHRAGQKSAPKIALVTLPDVKAESRFAASICARLAQLGALSSGDRRSGAGCVDFGEAASLTGPLANRAAESAAAKHSISLGSSPTSIKLMNRCLAKPPTEGNEVMATFRSKLSDLEANSRYKSSRITDIEADGVKIEEVDSFERKLPPGLSGRSLVKTYQVDRGLDFDSALKCTQAKEGVHRRVAIYKKKNPAREWGIQTSPILLVDIVHHGDEGDYTAKLVRPNGNRTTLQQKAFERTYEEVESGDEEARTLWDEWHKRGTTDGSRFKTFSMMTLPIIDYISSNYISTVRLLRVTNGSEALLGMRLEEWTVKLLKNEAEKACKEAGPSSAP